MTELTSNARFIQGINMLTSKIQDPIALEALVKAMEASLEGKGYEVTEKDVGSLVYVWDAGDEEYPKLGKLLVYNVKAEFYPYAATVGNYRYAKPYLDPIALHFIPFYATENSVAPDDLGKHYAVLWSNGDIELVLNVYNEDWTHKKLDELWIIGYRPLKFVNPLEGV